MLLRHEAGPIKYVVVVVVVVVSAVAVYLRSCCFESLSRRINV